MNKTDKIIALIGVIMLVISGIGIFSWQPSEAIQHVADIDDFFDVTSTITNLPDTITVSDDCPFYPLIVTPIAVHYDNSGEKTVVPLYVKNIEEPSSAVARLEESLNFAYSEELIDPMNAINYSIYIARKYWETSDAVLIIKYNETGYNLAVSATPIASYLGIPVIVADEITTELSSLFEDLNVKYSFVCGDIKGYGKELNFENNDEILDSIIKLVQEKFGDVEYITVANPMDAFQPEVLETTTIISEKGILKSSSSLLPQSILNSALGRGGKTQYSVKIPEDYKYALVKLDLRNLENPDNIEKFGDNILIQGSLTGYLRTVAYPAERDANGNVIEDRLHYETVFYDSGNEEYSISLVSSYHTQKQGEYEITVTAEKLSNPYYAMMPKFSSLAPYLASYHKGIVFADTKFAFAANDDVKYNGKTITGNTQVLYNPSLIPNINKHAYENIHIPLNNLIAKIKDIDISETVEYLQDACYDTPLYIAIIGDTIMLPQYYFRSPHNDPFDNAKSGNYGTNCPSDFLYGNIDPEIYSMQPYSNDHLENDLYSDYPIAENIVGRITGYDVQDASALIARTIFYDEILEDYEEWKDNAAVLIGAGCEMQKLPIITAINKFLFQNTEPQKFPSGEKYFLLQRILRTLEKGGFEAEGAERGRAQMSGYSWDALMEIAKSSLGNRIWFRPLQVKLAQGIENKDSFKLKNLIENLFGSEEDIVIGGQLEKTSNFIISDSHAIWFEKESGDVLMNSLGMPLSRLGVLKFLSRYFPLSIRSPLDQKGAFDVREVSNVEMGPSVMMVEGCGSGKIDGMPPMNSLASTYLHAGVNAYISPTTLSAFYGALEPRFGQGVGFGIIGYLKALINLKSSGTYPPVHFNQWIFEKSMLDMFDNDISIGVALRNAKNEFLPSQFDVTYRWTPPLSISSSVPQDIIDDIQSTSSGGDSRFPVEKYCTIYQINLLGDPAFNPYEPIND